MILNTDHLKRCIGTLDLPQKYLEQVKAMLRTYVPLTAVWAYGSRVTGGGHEASDLDLVLRNSQNPLEESAALYDLQEAFIESDLPIRVDIMDWARIPTSFHREIERAHVVVQEGGVGDSSLASFLKHGV